MPEKRLTFASLTFLIITTATYMVGARSLPVSTEASAGSSAPTHGSAFPIKPHFVMSPRLSMDNGALRVDAKIAGLGDESVGVVVFATALTICSTGPSVQQTLTAARPAVFPSDGVAAFSISTEPLEMASFGGTARQTQFRDVIVSVYQGNEVILEQVLNRGG